MLAKWLCQLNERARTWTTLPGQDTGAPGQINHLLIRKLKVLIGVQTTSKIPHGDNAAIAMHHLFHECIGTVNTRRKVFLVNLHP